MKFTAIFLLAACLQVTANGFAQQVTISMKNVPVQKVLKEINRQTGYQFFYKDEFLDRAGKVSVAVTNASLEQVLNICFKDQQLTYTIVDRTIIVKEKSPDADDGKSSSTNTAAFLPVSGRITDGAGKPVSGVSIQVKGTSKGTTSDDNGSFLIDAKPGDVLLISFVGFQSQQVKVGSSASLNIILHEAITEMTEMVITGFQKREKTVAVGSVGVVTAKDFENTGITTFDKSMEGKIAGLYVRSNSGRPGETSPIIIRGINTLSGSTEPLYVLDGMPLQPGEANVGGVNNLITNGIGNIPPENIESITILKDATAASIYGSLAANGVIVITTKTGKAGADYITYSGKYEITMKPQNKFPFMSSEQKIEFEKGLLKDFHPPYESGGRVVQLQSLLENGAISQAEKDAQMAQLAQTNTDWMDYLYRVAHSQSHNITLSGGNTKTTYFTSFNYQNAQGALIENRYQIGGLNMKLARYITDKVLVKTNFYATLKKNEEGGGQGGVDPFRYAVFANPYEKPYNDDGSYRPDITYRPTPFNVASALANYYTNFNMIREMKENKFTTLYGNVRGQLSVEYDFLPGFKYTGSIVGAYTTTHGKDESFGGTYRSWIMNWLKSTSNGALGVLPEYNRGFLQEMTSRIFEYTVRNSAEFNKYVGKKHFMQGFFASEFGAVKTDQFYHFNPIYLQQYGIAGYPQWDLVPDTRFQLLDLSRLGGTRTAENRSASFIGSVVYSYNSRYVFNANARYDGVDIIGSTNQFSPLWSAGVKWNAHNEDFIKKYEFINRLVLSVGYGYRGSINRSVLPFQTYTFGTAVYNGVLLATSYDFGNPVIRWEKKKETNLGLELSLFKGRINTELRYFDEKIIDLLDNTVLPPSVGRSVATINSASLTNKGYEITARVEVLKGKNYLWEVGGNFTHLKNNIYDSYVEDPPVSNVNSTYNIQGYPVNAWFGYKFAYVDPLTGSMMVYAQKRTTIGEKTTYSDQLVNLSTITQATLIAEYSTYYLGHKDPDSYGGFNTRLQFKSFEVAANFVMATGNKILSFNDRRESPNPNLLGTQTNVGDIPASRTNRLVSNLYRWRQPGDITDIPLYRYSASNYTSFLIDKDIEDGSYLKCTETSLSWRAPRQLLEKTAMKTLKATLVANNLFLLSRYSGIDPETQTPFSYPNTRMYTLSLNVGF